MKGTRKLMGFSTVLVLALGLVVPPASWAQAAKAKKGEGTAPVEIEEITVTAQKREENIQEVPISVTAITGAALEQKGVASFTDLNESVPNLYATAPGFSTSSAAVAMRGLSGANTRFSTNTAVGLYIDGVYIAKVVGSNFDLEDLDRVEALRGPQGTLFGRNNTGGAVSMVTRKPTEERSITASTEVGNYDAFKGRVTLNVPLIGKNGYFQSDAVGTLSLRENAVYKSHDGWAQNQSPTDVKASGGSELGTQNRVFNMTSLRWQPTQDITVDYAYEYHRYRQTPPGLQVTAVTPGSNVAGALGPAYDLRPYIRTGRALGEEGYNAQLDPSNTAHRMQDDGNNRMHFLTGAWNLGEVGPLGSVTVKSISGYRNFTTDGSQDLDGSPLHVFENVVHQTIETWSEELQWVGTAPRLKYVLGAYFYGEHGSTNGSNLIFPGSLTNGVTLVDTQFGKNSASAGFGQATWTPPILNDKLSLTVGLRYGEDHVHAQTIHDCVSIYNPAAPAGLNICQFNIIGVRSFNKSVDRTFGREGAGFPGLSPLGDITYQWTDELMTYVRVSRGYQSGAANDTVSDERQFGTTDPERLESYEAGFKSQWLDNRLRFNADGFLNRYKDQVITVNTFSTTGGLSGQNINAGKEEMWGSEVELTAIPLRGLEATASYSYLAAKYLEYSQQAQDANGNGLYDKNNNPILVNVANQRRATYSPAHTFNVGLTYTAPPTTAGVFSAHIDTFWTASIVSQPEPPYTAESPAYAVVNGRLQLFDIPLAEGSLDLSVFGRNLFDRRYRVSGFSLGALGWVDNAYGDPRTFGVGLTYHFTAS